MFSELDRERRRIEAALHDGVQQDLAATAVRLQLVRRVLETDPAAAAELLTELEADVEAALERLRGLAGTIYPSSLPTRGLAAAFAGRVEAGPLGRYSPEVEEAVYFACRGLLTDAAHARVWERDGVVRFEVAGAFDHSAVEQARARVAAVGGQLTVSPDACAGAVPVSSAR